MNTNTQQTARTQPAISDDLDLFAEWDFDPEATNRELAEMERRAGVPEAHTAH